MKILNRGIIKMNSVSILYSRYIARIGLIDLFEEETSQNVLQY